VLRHDDGHAVLDTLFSYEHNPEKEFPDQFESAFTVDIDDCDCDRCAKNRGELQMYATLGVSIHTPDGVYTQRLTPDEASALSEVLARYAKVLKGVAKVEPTPWTPTDSV